MTSPNGEATAAGAADFSAVDAVYVSPTYLRAHIRDYLYNFDKGLYWLRAPPYTGKTLFVRGIIARRLAKDQTTTEGIDSNIATGVRTVGVHMHKDGCATPRQFVDAMLAAFAAEFKLDDAERAAAAPEIRYADAAEARADFLAWLQKLRETAAAKGAQRLLVCVDGLEQAAPPADGATGAAFTIVDMLPAVADIPQGVIVVLTSRPADAWPPALFQQAAEKFGSGFGLVQRDITLDDDAYVKMLRVYFWDKVRPMFRSRAMAHLEALLENKARLSTDKDSRLAADLAFRDGLKGDWKKLTNKHPRYSMNQLPVGDLKQTLDEIDKLWADTMDRAEQRFAFVSHVLGRVTDGSLTLDKVAELPKGEAMLANA